MGGVRLSDLGRPVHDSAGEEVRPLRRRPSAVDGGVPRLHCGLRRRPPLRRPAAVGHARCFLRAVPDLPGLPAFVAAPHSDPHDRGHGDDADRGRHDASRSPHARRCPRRGTVRRGSAEFWRVAGGFRRDLAAWLGCLAALGPAIGSGRRLAGGCCCRPPRPRAGSRCRLGRGAGAGMAGVRSALRSGSSGGSCRSSASSG